MTVAAGARYQEYLDCVAQWSDIQGHLKFLYNQAATRTAPVIIELGVRSGASTRAFLAAAEDTRGQVWSCDVSPADVPAEWRDDPLWHFIQGDDLDPLVSSRLPGQCDVLFIDTTHDHDQTLAELTLYMPRLKPGGVAVLHDTCWGEDGLKPDRGVATALDAWCLRNDKAWENRAGSYGMGVIHA